MLAILSGLGEEERGSLLLQLTLRNTNLSVAELDANLVLRLTDAARGEEDADQMLLDDEAAAASQVSFEDLPTLKTSFSFLDWNERRTFRTYLSAFQTAMPSKRDLSAYLNLPSLSKSAVIQQPTTLTFFAHAWTSDAPPSVRVKALQVTRELLDHIKKSKQPLDFQALIPYIITALGDPVKAVRSAAAATCIAWHSVYDATKLKEATIWARGTFYANHGDNVQWLSSADAHKFFSDTLLPILEDCVVDQSYIVQ